MAKRTVYIAGPMSKYADSDYNYPAFDAAEEQWKARGWQVLNPTHNTADVGFALPYGYYIKCSINMLMVADAIAMLPGWTESTGAKMEYVVATALGLEKYDALTFEPLAPHAVTVTPQAA